MGLLSTLITSAVACTASLAVVLKNKATGRSTYSMDPTIKAMVKPTSPSPAVQRTSVRLLGSRSRALPERKRDIREAIVGGRPIHK